MRQPSSLDTTQLSEIIHEHGAWVQAVRDEMAQVIVGQEGLVDRLLVGLLSNGHVLLEGVPGLAKTLTVKALAGSLNAQFQRIQFTPDLLPADLIGTLIYNPQRNEFTPKLGPIFTNLVLADEINRAPAKVQSALLESMAERQVTIGDTTYALPDPFLVLATMNPIDQEGTYQLPEAQLDRFLIKVVVDYPTPTEERLILDRMSNSQPRTETQPVIGLDTVLESRQIVDQIYVDGGVKDYIVNIIHATRYPEMIDPALKPLVRAGASPRGTINLTLAAKAHAFLQGRGYVVPQDVKSLVFDVLRHRILLSYEAEAEEITSVQIIARILERIPVP
ncbi:MAG TPA: MoxR family ATPase [Verrucomicrobiales bacterium]|nr:MoxR family ATPase [Verrucomicrobiae bacterium]MCP5552909.1 MoxR family ATPase [Akkermansiaceae bacterium]HRX53899.1 MoxR family ATPase [Verrucomicrobiales bacterium]